MRDDPSQDGHGSKLAGEAPIWMTAIPIWNGKGPHLEGAEPRALTRLSKRRRILGEW